MSLAKHHSGYDIPKVGGDVLAYCGKCKMELAHVVIAMLKTTPAKVQCKTCKATHKFRGIPGTTSKARPGVTKPPPKSVISAAQLWEKKMAENTKKSSQPYSIKTKLKKGDLIEHPKFGVGIVELEKSTTKVLVLFQGGERTLVCGLT